MNKTIEEIASQHLGKAGDGTVVKPYVTPDFIDNTLLVPVPRVLNRTAYNIDEQNLPFVGQDVWNAYEFSTLTENGFPVVGHVKIVYDSNSHSIVESKSLKLYLNSFNMVKLGSTVQEVVDNSKKIITHDLTTALGIPVNVEIFTPPINMDVGLPVSNVFLNVEMIVPVNKVTFNAYNETPDLLESTLQEKNTPTYLTSSSLRSNCRVTNQPDWGDVYVYMLSKHKLKAESFLKYLVSMRKENHFHEEICECIYKRLHDKFNPDELFVACLYTRRGGIDINPVRASNQSLIDNFAKNLVTANKYVQKLWRQ
jgi:7-cyano-7-deazaguanine reductase